MAIDVLVFGTGAILLLTGILGGGFEISVLKIPRISWAPRVFTLVAGVFFIVLGLGLSFKNNNISLYGNNNLPVNNNNIRSNNDVPPANDIQNAANPQDAQVTNPVQPGKIVSPTIIIEDQKASLISAIRLADDAEIEATQTLKTDKLYSAFSGEALRTELSQIEDLKSNGIVKYSQLEDQQFIYFKVSSDGKRAEVKVIETWSTVVYSAATNNCIGKVPSHEAPQTVFLKHSNEGWVVDSIIFDSTTKVDMISCN